MPEIKRRSTRVEDVHVSSGESWLEQHRDELPKDSWVAARGPRMIAHANDMGALINVLKEKNVDPSDVTIIFNDSLPV